MHWQIGVLYIMKTYMDTGCNYAYVDVVIISSILIKCHCYCAFIAVYYYTNGYMHITLGSYFDHVGNIESEIFCIIKN